MTKDLIVTLDDKDKYLLVDETEQNGDKYFLATKLDENNEPFGESLIFKEVKEGEEFYLEEETDEKKLNYLSAIFISNFNDIVDELNEAA